MHVSAEHSDRFVGCSVGNADGSGVGVPVGGIVGSGVGSKVGSVVGMCVGKMVLVVGIWEGIGVGGCVGA